ncbi:MAG: hypothetical protein ACKO96_15805, partial [Flammeovirgaceae bacterium]
LKKSFVFVCVHFHADHCITQLIVVLYVVGCHYIHLFGVLIESIGSRCSNNLLLLIAALANRTQTTQQHLND